MQRYAGFVTTAIATVLAGYLIFAHRDHEQLTELPPPAHPGYYLSQATLIETNSNGQPRLNMQAATITQDLENDQFNLQQVTVRYRSEDSTLWLMTADAGELPQQSQRLYLSGNVFIRAEEASTKRPKIRTSHLTIDPEHYLASTESPVSFEMDAQQLSAVGLQYNLKQQTLQLNSHVIGTFKSPKPNEQ